jgi:dynein heavy chain
MRPDRLSNALIQYVKDVMGEDFIEQPAFDFMPTFIESSYLTPFFFVLFPGEDPTPMVEKVGMQVGKTAADRTFTNISMGQGQEKIAENCLTDAAKHGKWIMLQNVHLMITWMKGFERKLEIAVSEDCHADFRVFISSEPPPLPDMEIIPEAILQNSIKIANEAPQNLKANLRRAFSKFDQDNFERAKSHKEKEYKALLFGLCMFHSLILGRKKFGAQGWSRNYNFNDGDLTICGDVLHNYLTQYEIVPYNDLKYIFGEIMYGGHITDDLDRRTNRTYLEKLIKPEILQQMILTMFHPGFKSPDPMKFDREKYSNYIETALPAEVPQMFGLHPNAEIGYLTTQAEQLFIMI